MSEKFLSLPVKPFTLNQSFGEDKACVSDLDNTTVVYKETAQTCPINFTSLYKKAGLNGHNGLDLNAYHGQPVYAACEGLVREIQTEEARGLGIGIVTQEKYYCNETKTKEQFKIRYWHLKTFNVQHEQVVKKGDLIGYADNTGFSSGDHLHFEVKPVQVLPNMKIINLLPNNGFAGAVDPLQYIEMGVSKPKYIFNNNLSYGMKNNSEVKKLQEILAYENLFNKDLLYQTGNYYQLTAKAVLDFQKKYNVAPISELEPLAGRSVGPKTRAKLNQLFGI